MILVMVPFTRLSHVIVAPLNYLVRPYQQVIWNWNRKTIRDPATAWNSARAGPTSRVNRHEFGGADPDSGLIAPAQSTS